VDSIDQLCRALCDRNSLILQTNVKSGGKGRTACCLREARQSGSPAAWPPSALLPTQLMIGLCDHIDFGRCTACRLRVARHWGPVSLAAAFIRSVV